MANKKVKLYLQEQQIFCDISEFQIYYMFIKHIVR